MPHFIFRGYDDPTTSADIRLRFRPDHRAYIRQENHSVRVVAGGMVVTDLAEDTIGTLLILEGPDRAAVMRYLEGDPYWDTGLFARYEVDRWEWGLGTPTP